MITNTVKHSLSRKYMLAVLVTTFTALVVAGTAMLMYDLQSFRTSWASDLSTQSDILGGISLSALEFNDAKVASENLMQLKSRSNIFAAAIYDSNGKLFATYRSDINSTFGIPPTPHDNGYIISGDQIAFFNPITRNGEMVGTVYLAARYPLYERALRYTAILTAVILASLLVAGLVSTWLQSAVTKPILAVTDAVHKLIRTRDFSIRVEKTTVDEVGVLVDAFNSMLIEVGNRAQAVEKSNQALQHEINERLGAEDALRVLNSTLEERIEARTVDLERAHEQLRQSQKMEAIGQLTGGVAHDFNNVLQVIAGNLQLLKMSLTENAQAQRRIETAVFATDRGAKLASHLLSFARRQPLQPMPINLGRILRGMDDLLSRSIGASIQIETVVAGGLWTTLVDPYQLENVVLNLAINARDAMKAGGKLTLELGNAMLDDHYAASEVDVAAGQYVMLAVSDNGTGMTVDTVNRAFEPFFTTKKDGEGTGLGLSMAYGFVRQSNGHIKIYSEVGSGTTIKIYLPRCTQTEVMPENALAQPVIGGTETILVVEDDTTVRSTAIDMLTGLGYRVLTAHDGESALTVLLSGASIDLLFTDVVMPGPVKSTDMAKQAKQMFPDIEVLFTSGYTQNAIVHGGRLDPGVELIGKPYRREDLARKIRHLLANRKMISNAAKQSHAETISGQIAKSDSAMRILVVEDNKDAQDMLCDVLTILGHSATGVIDAEKALEVFTSEHFDVLLTDVNLPGMSGIDLARKIAPQSPTLKIIFSSGYGVVASKDLGFESTSLAKPFNLEELQRVLARM